MRYFERILQLSGLREAVQVMDPDEEDRLYDERHAREQHITRLIAIAFKRIGLDIAEDGIFYTDDNREAYVTLDDTTVDLALLSKLLTTGLAQGYKIWAANDMQVVFTVNPDLDHAVIK